MRKQQRRNGRIAFILALVTVFLMIPFHVFAGEEPEVKIMHKDSEVAELTLIEDDRVTLSAVADGFPEDDELSYQWEILVNKNSDSWAKIADRTDKECIISLSLVASLLDSLDRATVRVSVTDGQVAAVSEPLTVQIQRIIPLETLPVTPDSEESENNSELDKTEDENSESTPDNTEATPLNSTNTATDSGENINSGAVSEPRAIGAAAKISAPNPSVGSAVASSRESGVAEPLADDTPSYYDDEQPSTLPEHGEDRIYSVVIYYHYVNAAGEYVGRVTTERTLTVKHDNEKYSALLPVQMGYTPTLKETDFDCTLRQDGSNYYLDLVFDNISDDVDLYVIYTPNSGVKYSVNHYKQNPDDEGYTLDSTDSYTGIVGEPVPGNLAKEIPGFNALYYVPEKITPDGNMVVSIYYDANYFLVSFDLDKNGQDQDPIYVRNGTTVYLNTPSRIGFGFVMYALRDYGDVHYNWVCTVDNQGNASFTYNGADQNVMAKYQIGKNQVAGGANRKGIKVDRNLHYEAIWSSSQTNFTVLYWRENADNGNYSLWGKQTVEGVQSGTVVNAADYIVDDIMAENANLPEAIKVAHDREFFICNEEMTRSEGDVTVQGNNTTTINVYFTRRIYTLEFKIHDLIPAGTLAEDCKYAHTHGESCIMGVPNSKHVHTDECRTVGVCTKEEHVHDPNNYEIICGLETHTHDERCCDVHVHSPVCYGAKSNTPETNLPNGIPTRAEQGEIYVNAVKQSGWFGGTDVYYYVFIDRNWYVMSQEASSFLSDLLAEWCKNNQGNDGAMSTGQIATPQYCTIHEYDLVHDHTYGCVYGTCAHPDNEYHLETEHHTCWGPNDGKEHIHTDACYNCDKEEHVHGDYCNCTHVHNEDCYSHCILTHDCADHATKDLENPSAFTISAKYGQTIDSIWPDYQVMANLGWHELNGDTFYAWNFQVGEGENATTVTQYYKYPTMTDHLCYTYGVDITAMYASEVQAYAAYFLIEDLDQSEGEGEVAFDKNGAGRVKYNGKWYTSDAARFQGFLMTEDPVAKELHGMVNVHSAQIDNMILNEKECKVFTFYYDRKVNSVQLYNSDTTTPVLSFNDVKFGTPLSKIIPPEYMNGTALQVPEQFKQGYRFGGWYTSEYPSEATKVYNYTASTDYPMILFAYWEPIRYNVQIYNSDPSIDQAATLNTELSVPYGNTIDFDMKDFEHPTYSELVGAFYRDDTDGDGELDTEKAFLFNNIPIKEDMVLYAKWSSRETVKYTVSYVAIINDEEVKVAPDEEGYALSGQSKTFTAKTSASLYTEYQKFYYPTMRSATVLMEGEEVNYTFTYEYDEEIEYYVHYVHLPDSENPQGSQLDADLLAAAGLPENGIVVKRDHDKRYAVVTETFVPIMEHLPDAFSKSKILTANKGDDPNYPYKDNHIYFYYTHNTTDAYYKIVHQIENLDGSYSELVHSQIIGAIGAQTAPELPKTNLVGFEFAGVSADYYKNGVKYELGYTETDGAYTTTVRDEGTTLYFSYQRKSYPYSGIYTDASTETQVLSPTVTGNAKYQETVTVPYQDLEPAGWQVVGDAADRSIVIEPVGEGEGELRSNSVVFKYTELTAVITYHLAGEGGRLDGTTQDVVGAATGKGVIGSRAVLDNPDDYRFVGWFLDEKCTVPAVVGAKEYTLSSSGGLENNCITPNKYLTSAGYELYQPADYYALFVPNNSELTVTVNLSAQDSESRYVLLNIVGTDGRTAGINLTVALKANTTKMIVDLPVGDYTVTPVTDWSWRYDEGGEKNVTVGVGGGSITLDLTLQTEIWLDSETHSTYHYTPYGG